MRELTLELLAPYLPYKLIFMATSADIVYKKEMYGLDYESRCELYFNTFNDREYSLKDGEWKPILKPLSDFNNSEADKEIFETGNYYTSVLLNEPTDLPFWEVQILLKHHFDIFGLLKDGLAMDSNTISHE